MRTISNQVDFRRIEQCLTLNDFLYTFPHPPCSPIYLPALAVAAKLSSCWTPSYISYHGDHSLTPVLASFSVPGHLLYILALFLSGGSLLSFCSQGWSISTSEPGCQVNFLNTWT